MNKTQQLGRLVKDPELRKTGNDKSVCNFTIANNYKNGDYEENLFLDCIAWGKTAETIVKYIKKGQRIGVVGRLRTEKWEDQNGNPRSAIKMTVEGFDFIEKSENSASSTPDIHSDDEIPF